MRRALLFLATLLFLAVATGACDGDDESLELPDSPEGLWEQARAAMAALDSYAVSFTFPYGPEEIGWDAEVAAPDSYHFLLVTAEGETKEECAAPVEEGVFVYGTPCREVFTEITERSVLETILVGDKAYSRQCEDQGTGCGQWQQRPRPQLPIAGPSPTYAPQWPLVAVELAEPVEVVGREEIGGTSVVHLHGRVNHLRAIFENERRVLTAAGISSFGRECTAEASAPGEPPGEEVCRDLTFEESLEQQEPDLSFYDKNPAVIDIWVSPDDLFIRRIAIGAPPPPEEPESGQVALIIEYSRFNQVQVSPPQ
ncbi:MAG: hypothetical protein A2148_06390 [Chloroflexi bacterium RBG_16_68_14]|nr:MAG: hypothetical protein A2148_06390 [Chloroflexi bacterium RBG_16_68_14]